VFDIVRCQLATLGVAHWALLVALLPLAAQRAQLSGTAALLCMLRSMLQLAQPLNRGQTKVCASTVAPCLRQRLSQVHYDNRETLQMLMLCYGAATVPLLVAQH
jgi:hypothetical protein